MKMFQTFMGCIMLFPGVLMAQLTGNKYIGTITPAPDYVSVAAAIADLNTNGTGPGGVTFNIAAGYTETISSRINITATGTSSNPIIFQKYGSGANPLITAYTGTATPSSATPDGIWSLTGSDYLTIDGIDLRDLNITSPATMEYGYGLFKAGATDGCQNNTIKNCTVTLNKSNNDAGTGPMPEGSVCILIINATPVDAQNSVIITNETGSNSLNDIYSNILQKCNYGIVLSGFSASPTTLGDHGNDVGGNTPATGNFIYAFGGAASAVNPAAGIKAVNQWQFTISYNILNNLSSSGTAHVSNLRGIWLTGASNSSPVISFNTINVTCAATSTQVLYGIENNSGTSGTVNITDNTVTCTYTPNNQGEIKGIYTDVAATNLYITDNNVSISTGAGSGEVNAIHSSGAVSSVLEINDNNITSLTLTRSGTTCDVNSIYLTGCVPTSTCSINDNIFSNHSYTGASGGAGPAGISNFSCIHTSGSALFLYIKENSFNNLSIKKSSGDTYLVNNECSVSNSGGRFFQDNYIETGFSTTLSTGGQFQFYSDQAGGPLTVSGNDFSNITLAYIEVFYGFFISASHNAFNIYNNTFSHVTCAGGSIFTVMGVHGFAGTSGSPNGFHHNEVSFINTSSEDGGCFAINNTLYLDVYENTVHDLTYTAPYANFNGFWFKSINGTIRAYRNQVYNMTGSGTSPTINAMKIGDNQNIHIYNNFISDLKTPSSTNVTSIYGINNITGTNVNIYNNTIFLNATSTGVNFGTTGVFSAVSSNLCMRNNNIINISTAKGTGKTVCYKRENTSLTNYSGNSNDNNFYAGTPSSSQLIYIEGSSNPKQTIDAYRTFMTPREGRSFSELPPFVNVSTIPYDLHLKQNIPTQCESWGHNITSPFLITRDFDDDIRYGNTGYSGTGTKPDIGADEWEGVPRDTVPPAITFTPLSNTYSTQARTLTASITDAWWMPKTGTDLPVLYWKKNSGSYTAVTGTWVSGNTYSFSLGSGTAVNDVISYYICAQDSATNPNVTSYPLSGATGFTINPPACSTPPTVPATYIILPLAAGNYRVGGTGTTPCPTCTFVDITEAFSVLNNETISGSVNLVLTSFYNSAEENSFPLILNNVNGISSTNRLKIIPDAGASVSITGSAANNAILKFNASSYVTIEGSNNSTTSRNLTISNTSVTNPYVIWMASSGTNGVNSFNLRNCIIRNGINTSPAVIISDNSAPATAGYFNNISIYNNSIGKCSRGIWVNGGSSANGISLSVSGNDLSVSGTDAIGNTGIYLEGVQSSSVYLNTIGNFNSTANENDAGIVVGSGCRTTDVYRNEIFGLGYSGAGNYGAHGIKIATGVNSAAIRVFNNLIYNITAPGDNYTVNPLNNPAGIVISGTQTDINIFSNTVNLYGNSLNRAGALSQGIHLGTGSRASIRSNMIVNNLGRVATSGNGATGIFCQEALTGETVLDFNNYYVNPTGTGTKNIGRTGTTEYTTLNTWKTATGQENNSENFDPIFVSNTDLHFQNNSFYEKGLFIIGNDFNNDLRHNPPDIGAYEMNYKIWNGTVSADWTNGSNWSPAGVPAAYHNILIPAPTVFSCKGNASGLNCKTITINCNASVTIDPVNSLTIHKDHK